jgi:UDP-N-acetyl-D-galactosamine dehydrogenase
MYPEILERKKLIAVIGMGYVGLPIALEFARETSVIGFDIDQTKIASLNKHIDSSGEISKEEFINKSIYFTSNPEELKKAHFFIIAVPTPIDLHNVPDLRALRAASKTVGQVLKEGDYVVYESTVYPGCTEDDCVPILERESGLKAKEQFKYGYSPERINPGDKEHTLSKIVKVVSGCDQKSLDTIADIYGIVVKAGIFKAKSIKVAEAAKVIENTQRDLNIALMNELSIIFDKMNINTFDVLEAAGTKWNFLKFTPGLVGGHCIGVDPYYLTYKAKELGYDPLVILSGRNINDNMGAYVGKRTVKMLIQAGFNLLESKVLVLGATFKENVKDIRNSKVVDLIKEIQSYGLEVDIVDPIASGKEFAEEYSLNLKKLPDGKYQAIILAVPHTQFVELELDTIIKHSVKNTVFIDLKGIFKEKFNSYSDIYYWSL